MKNGNNIVVVLNGGSCGIKFASFISSAHNKVKVLVIPTHEERVMLNDALWILPCMNTNILTHKT